jgi:hypothetical protein
VKTILLLTLLALTSCATLEERRREEFYNSSPAGFTEVITSKRVSKLKPIQIIKLLKKNCCDAVMIEPTAITSWTQEDMAEIRLMLGDKTFVAPVASTAGTFSCRGPRYMSTVDREVQHLIRAFKEKTYPLAQCSTLDLKVDTND